MLENYHKRPKARWFDVEGIGFLKVHMNLLYSLVRMGLPLSTMVPHFKSFFYYMTKSDIERIYSADGYRVFRSRFVEFQQAAQYLVSFEDVSEFCYKFYEFLNECFPTRMSMEV